MREGKFRLQVGALVLGVGLAFGVAAPAIAEETASAVTPDGLTRAVADTEQSFVEEIVVVDPQVAFTDAFLACQAGFGISDCVDETFENIGLRAEEGTTVDNTPLNPVDEGSLEFVDDVDLSANPPGV
ncbi:MAG: hypothetical protein M3509_07120 [Chloroflexota bacterium]|nr:hypothetical protein [Chloroflexota bacterium]